MPHLRSHSQGLAEPGHQLLSLLLPPCFPLWASALGPPGPLFVWSPLLHLLSVPGDQPGQAAWSCGFWLGAIIGKSQQETRGSLEGKAGACIPFSPTLGGPHGLGKERKGRKVKSLSRVRLSAAPWTVASQAPLSMGFSRQEYWGGLPCPSPGDLPDLGIKPGSPGALPSGPPGKLT